MSITGESPAHQALCDAASSHSYCTVLWFCKKKKNLISKSSFTMGWNSCLFVCLFFSCSALFITSVSCPCLSHLREFLCENSPALKCWALIDADSHAGTVDPFSLQSCSTISAGDNSEKLHFCVLKVCWARPHSSPWKAGQS